SNQQFSAFSYPGQLQTLSKTVNIQKKLRSGLSIACAWIPTSYVEAYGDCKPCDPGDCWQEGQRPHVNFRSKGAVRSASTGCPQPLPIVEQYRGHRWWGSVSHRFRKATSPGPAPPIPDR